MPAHNYKHVKVVKALRLKLKEMLPYLSVAAACYYILPLFGKDTGSFMLILLVAVPVICFVSGLLYGIKHGFCLYFGFFSGSLFIPSIFLYYNNTAWPYIIIYGLASLLGNFLGKAFYKQ
jgi:hypothetical protein